MKRLDEILTRATLAPSSSSGSASQPGSPEAEPSSSPVEAACPVCGGAGFLRRDLPLDDPDFGKAVPCECVRNESEESRLGRLQRFSSLGPLTRLSFANLIESGRSVNRRDQEQFRRLAADARAFAEEPAGWLFIHGPSGAGKTHVAAAIANRCLERGQPALFVVVPDLLDHLRAAYNPSSEIGYDALFEQVRTAPVLILDDLGTQNATAWAQEKLYQLLNHRYNAQLPTIVTTNLGVERLDERMRMRLTDPAIASVYYVEAAARAIDVNLPDAFDLDQIREMTFESFDFAAPHLKEAERWSLETAYRSALKFAEEPQNWLLISGPNGCGKTHLAAAIANRCRSRGERPVFFVVADLNDYFRQLGESGPGFVEGFNQVSDAPLLILDDLGSGSDLPFVRARLNQLVNHRYLARLPTVFTMAGEETVKNLDIGFAVRLNDPKTCTSVPITAPAYRVDIESLPAAASRRPAAGRRPGPSPRPRGR